MLIDLSTIGNRLREARLTAGLSQIELSEKLGVTQGTISRAESGRDSRVSTLIEIARALDLDLMAVPRRLRSIVEQLIDGRPSDHTAVYTGAGAEPYYEAEQNETETRTPVRMSPYDLASEPGPRRRAHDERGQRKTSM